jgi:hypothetical protein
MDSTSKTIVIAFSTFSLVFILGLICGFLLGSVFNKTPLIEVNNYANCSVEKAPYYFPNYWNTISTGVVPIPNATLKEEKVEENNVTGNQSR